MSLMPRRGVHDLDAPAHQLKAVPVASHHQNVPPVPICLAGDGGDDVVCFVPLLLDLSDFHHVEHLSNERQLATEGIRSRLALGLVLGIGLGAERRPTYIPCHHQPLGRVIVEQFDEHRHEAVGSVGHLTGLRSEVLGKRVEGPIRQAVPVE